MSQKSDAPGFLIHFSAGLAVIGVGLLFAMVILAALPSLGPSANPFTWHWQPYQGKFGILPMLTGSLLLGFIALALGWPLSAGLACWLLAANNSPRLKKATFTLLRFMATIPTVVYGFAAVFLLTPLAREYLGGSGMCLAAAAIMLALLTTPTMTLVLLAGLKPRMERHKLSGLALGFTPLEIFCLFVLPAAKPNLAAAAILGFGRALGDTLLPLMLAGNAAVVPHSLADSMRSLTAHMALVTANEVGAAAYNSLFVAGLILLVTNAGISLVLRRLTRKRPEEKA